MIATTKNFFVIMSVTHIRTRLSAWCPKLGNVMFCKKISAFLRSIEIGSRLCILHLQ